MSGGGVNIDLYKAQMNKTLDSFDEKLLRDGGSVAPYFKIFKEKTQLRPSYLVVGLTTFITLFLIWGVGARFVANLVGFLWPVYESFRSLNDDKADEHDSQWLTYWVVYGLFTLTESLTDFLLLWIPLYHLVKIIFLVWCMAPQTRGALTIYHRLIEPILIRLEPEIDSAGRNASKIASRIGKDVRDEIHEEVSARTNDLVRDAVSNLTNNDSSNTATDEGSSKKSS